MARSDLTGQEELPLPEQPNAVVLRGIIGVITPGELAAAIRLSEQTLATWRSAKEGPSYVKLGKGIFYRMEDIQAWVLASITSVVTGGKPV